MLPAQASSPSCHVALLAADACIAALQLLTLPHLPRELLLSEVIDAVLDLVKSQLQYNVLVFHDARYRKLYRPSTYQAEDREAPGSSAKKRKTASKSRAAAAGDKVPPSIQLLLARLEVAVSLLPALLSAVRVEGELLLPLIRVLLCPLHVQGLQALATQVRWQDEAIAVGCMVLVSCASLEKVPPPPSPITVRQGAHCPLQIHQLPSDASECA